MRSTYFNHVANSNERGLLLELNQELINNFGVDIYIIPNSYVNVDFLYGEDRRPNLTNAIKIVAYVHEAATGYQGEPAFSKFGFYNPANIDLVVSRKEWQEIAGSARPTEGSIVYVPGWDTFGPTDFLKIDYVDKFEVGGFFPLGVHPTFTLQCSKWAYNSETVNTGVAEIDQQIPEFSNDITINPEGNPTDIHDNAKIIEKGNSFINFDEANPFGNPV